MKRLIVNGQVRPSSAAYLTNNVDMGRASSRALYTDVPIETDARWSMESCSIYRQLSLDARTKVNGISLSNFVALNGSSVRAEKVILNCFVIGRGWRLNKQITIRWSIEKCSAPLSVGTKPCVLPIS